MGLQMSWQLNLHRRKSGPPLGLKNLGNTCYLNSVLQCLTYTPPLANFCLKNQHSSLCESLSNSERKRDCPFCILERRIVRSLSIDGTLDAPVKIQNSIRIFAEHFRCGRQEDAHEFLRYVIDACHNTCVSLLKERLKQQSCSGGSDSPSYDTVVKQIFGGALQSQVKCLSCGEESNKVDEIMDISLDLFQSNSLKDAMRRFFQPEVLDGSNKYSCQKCKKLSAARKQMSVLQAPNVLVIQLKRFEGILGGKIDRPIAFGEILTLSNYMSKGNQETQDLQPEYKLFGSIVHSGYSPESGHYYAYIKDATGRWYCCNDSHVSLSTLEEVLSEKVYILFFSRTNQISIPSTKTTGSACNGIKSAKENGKSVEPKATVVSKPPLPKPYGPQLPQKDIPSKRMMGKLPSNSRITIGNPKMSESKNRADANGNGSMMVDHGNGASSTGSHSDHPTQLEGIKKMKTSLTSDSLEESRVTDRKIEIPVRSNGHNSANGYKSSHPVYCASKQKKYVPDGQGDSSQSNGVDSKKLLLSEDNNGNGKIVQVGIGSERNNKRPFDDSPGFSKRKLQGIEAEASLAVADSNRVSRLDADSGSELQEFKKILEKEASLELRSCGWVDKVQSFMHSRKRKRSQEADNSMEIKKLLIADAKQNFISQLPESLKEDLIDRIRSFRGGKQLVDV